MEGQQQPPVRKLEQDLNSGCDFSYGHTVRTAQTWSNMVISASRNTENKLEVQCRLYGSSETWALAPR